jgi:hypothetical protein
MLGPRTLSSVAIVTGNFLHEHIDALFGVVRGLLLGSFCVLCDGSTRGPRMWVEAFLGASRRDRVMCCRKRAGESSVYRTVCWMFLCPR